MSYTVAVEGVVVKDDQILITRRGPGEDYMPGVLNLPGGKVEGEGNIPFILEENLKREILEEVGIEVEDEMIYLESKLFPAPMGQIIDVVYLCKYLSGEVQITDPKEVASFEWMTCEKALAIQEMPVWTKNSIKLAAKKLGWL